jgi:PAS domain S-box-containing protein
VNLHRRLSPFHVYGVMCAAAIALYYLLPAGSGQQALVFQAVGLAAAGAVVAGIRLNRPARTLHLWTLAGGLVLMSAGDALFNLYEFVLHRSVFPSVADWVYLCAYVPFVAAVALLVRSRQRLGVSDLLDGAIVLSGAGLIFWFALIEPVARDGSASVIARLVSAAYPSFDVLLLVALAQLITTAGVGTVAFRLFAAGAVSLLVTDVVYGLQTLEGSYVPGGLLDVGWILNTTLWGLAALHPSIRTLHLHTPERETRLTWRRLFLLGGASLVAPAVVLRFAGHDRVGVGIVAAVATMTTLLVFARMALLFREHGHAVAALRDAQAHRAAEDALREWNDRFQSAARALDCAIYEWRFNTTEVFWTEGLQTAFGYPPERTVGNNDWFFEQVHPDDRAALLDVDKRVRAGEAIGETTYRFRHADGTYREVWDRWVVARDEESGGRVIGGMVDVTERRELERHYQQSQKLEAVGQLAGGIAHDFNNFLTAISGYAELLLTSKRLGDGERGDVQEIRRAADRAAALTSQLLTFSRRQSPESGTAELNDVVEGVRIMLARLLGPDIEIETELDSSTGAVPVDAIGLEQILVNLAVNARDAMPSGGSLRISTHLADGGSSSELRVADTGTGMDDEVMTHIFEPFFTTKAPGKGTGLGLSTVYGIVDNAGGTVAITSSPGAGTTFVITLPRVDAGPDTVTATPLVRRGSERILLVEDEAPVRAVVTRMLEAQGYDVVVAEDAEHALALFEREDFVPDLVLTDLVMPKLNGWVLADRVEQLRPGVPFLFVSGFSGHDALGEAEGHEDCRLLQKPFGGAELGAAVREALDGAPLALAS